MQRKNSLLKMSEYSKTNSHISACSANYLRISKLLNASKKNSLSLRNKIEQTIYSAQIDVQKLSEHTWICRLVFSNLSHKLLNSLQFVLNIYHDVELCEVASFNGHTPNRYPFSEENFPKSADEKLQQNRFLTEVVDMILTSGFYEK
ncbi:MAG: DUF1249 domain-containing protein [Proteobacteria bacterium]|nr:DUF1249 domain-containing protein [Pseudomonadota bacterium]